MKYICMALLLFCTNSFSQDLTGCWKNEGNSFMYDLILHEDNGKLSGTYCFINANGNRIDCDKNNSIVDGSIDNGFGIISFGGSGEGKLIYNYNYLTLKMIDSTPFDDFNMHIPEEVKFSRANECK